MATETKLFKDRHCEADKLKPTNDQKLFEELVDISPIFISYFFVIPIC